MEKQFHDILVKYIDKDDTVIAGISGGADSMALLHLLYTAGYKNIIVAHLNHCIRKESIRDAELVKKTCEKYGYVFEYGESQIKEISRRKKIGLEEAGRAERYRFFAKLKDMHKAKYILTAHHLDDNIETIIMNLARGAGVRGMQGLQKEFDGVIRPLLEISKPEIILYCKKKKLKFNEDVTNKDTRFTRNFIRHEIIPKFKKINPNFSETMRTTAMIFGDVQKYLENESEKYIRKQKNNRYSMEEFRSLPSALQSEILRQLYLQLYGNLTNLIYNHLEQIRKIINQNISGKIKEFGKGHVLKTEYYFFSIQKK